MTVTRRALFALFALLSFFVALAAAPRASAEEPEVRIVSPGPDDLVLGPTTVLLRVTGAQPADAVEVFADGRRVASVRGEPWTATWDAGEAPRAHALSAVLLRDGREVATSRVRTRGVGFTASASTRVVTLSPVVTDGRGRYVQGLTKEDFALSVDGRTHAVETFEAIDSKLSVVLVLDISASMALKLREMRAAALELVSTLKPEDEVAVLTFSNGVVDLTPFATDRSVARTAIEDARVTGETALYDATAAALRKLRDRRGRRAAVIFSDGADNRSRMSVDQVVEMARASEATIYAVGQGVADAGVLRDYLERMAEETGGRVYFISAMKKLAEAFREVVAELRSQYALTFTPIDQTPRTWHKVELRVGRPGLHTRVRKTFYLE